MSFLKRLVGAFAAGLGFFAVFKYLNDYTEFRAADKEDLDDLKNGTEKAKDAVKRTYVAIKESTDVTASAEELGKAVAQMAGGAGKLAHAVPSRTAAFVKAEKEKYNEDPDAYKQQVTKNLRSMQSEATGLFGNLKEQAEGVFNAVKEEAVTETYTETVTETVPEAADVEVAAVAEQGEQTDFKEVEAEASPAAQPSEAAEDAEAPVQEEPELIVTDDPVI